MFGWCNDGFHAGRQYRYGTPCLGVTSNGATCDCRCHRKRKPRKAEPEQLALDLEGAG